MFYTYILFSPSTNRFYTGHTSTTLEIRIGRHNNGDNPSTAPGIPWTLKFYKTFDTKTEAIKYENAIKRKKSRKYIEWLIQSESDQLREWLSCGAPNAFGANKKAVPIISGFPAHLKKSSKFALWAFFCLIFPGHSHVLYLHFIQPFSWPILHRPHRHIPPNQNSTA